MRTKMVGRIGAATLLLACSIPSTPPVQAQTPAGGGTLRGDYTDPRYLTSVPFGRRSDWVQPWRAYMETMPAQQFVNGIGIVANLNHGENPNVVLAHLRRNGFRHARIETGWDTVDPKDETRLNADAATRLRLQLRAMRDNGLRPLILLNANHGAPGPTRIFERTVTADAPQGARTVQLDDCSGLVSGRSGFNNLPGTGDDSQAAQFLVTSVDCGTKTVTLSKPLPAAVAAQTRVRMATLKYRPFSEPGTGDFEETIGGWKRYVQAVAVFAAQALGTVASTDKGFDMECWNELTFGSDFLFINRYYDPPFARYNEDAVLPAIMDATAQQFESSPSTFTGVTLIDGFSNTTPWPGAGDEPARAGGLSWHPYPPRRTYPAQRQSNHLVNALLQPEESDYAPNYSVLFPEYSGTAIQTETLIRNAAPITTRYYHIGREREIEHGRYARPNNPCWAWITEINITPNEQGITDPQAALAFKAKNAARFLCFYLNKGVQRVYLYGAAANDQKLGDLEFGMVRQNLLDYSRSHTTYPTNDAAFTSPAMNVTRRIVQKMQNGMDAKLTLAQTRPLTVTQISDTHGHFQFEGDGTPQHPTLYNREVFAFLPFQVNATKFVVPYYVMTRDVLRALPPEQYTVTVRGFKGAAARVSAYDPIADRAVPLVVAGRTADSLTLRLTAADYPYLLTVQE